LFCAARTTYVRAYQTPEQLAEELEHALKELIGDDRRSAAAVPQDRHSWCPFYYFMADKLVDNAAVREALAYAEPDPLPLSLDQIVQAVANADLEDCMVQMEKISVCGEDQFYVRVSRGVGNQTLARWQQSRCDIFVTHRMQHLSQRQQAEVVRAMLALPWDIGERQMKLLYAWPQGAQCLHQDIVRYRFELAIQPQVQLDQDPRPMPNP
jgi:hypothetical protein